VLEAAGFDRLPRISRDAIIASARLFDAIQCEPSDVHRAHEQIQRLHSDARSATRTGVAA